MTPVLGAAAKSCVHLLPAGRLERVLRDMNCYRFSAIRGVQAGRAYFVIMVPFSAVQPLFRFDDAELPPELTAQRDLTQSRIPAIARYIVDNAETYVLSALSASIDGNFRFNAAGDGEGERNVGTLEVDMTATLVINDGQHRRAAIVEALRERPYMAHETIAVTLFPDRGLGHAQQMFVDLNQHGVRPSRSLRIFYDARDGEAQVTKAVIDAVPLFHHLTDLTHVTPKAGSRKLFGLSSVHVAVKTLIADAGLSGDAAVDAAVEYWSAVCDNMPDWQAAARLDILPAELRRETVHAHGLALEALAIVGARLFDAYPDAWRARLAGLQRLDWSRANTGLWEGRAMVGGKVNRSRTSVLLTAELIWTWIEAQSGGACPQVVLQ
jgi:DNA sulfur modification protein DndB